MRILYLSTSYIPSRRASSIQVMEMCHAFAEQGHEVTLIAKTSADEADAWGSGPHDFYGLSPLFDVVAFPRPKRRGGGLVYEVSVARFLRRERNLWDLVYSRNLPGAWLAARLGIPTIFEAHEILNGKFAHRIYGGICRSDRLARIVSITDALRRDLEASGIVPRTGDMVVAPSAVNLHRVNAEPASNFGVGWSRIGDGLQAGYIGNLYPGRGIELILDLAARVPAMTFHIVGGDEESLERLRKQGLPANLVLHGFVRPEHIGRYYQLFDVLLLPHQEHVMGASGKTDIARWCSPMKLFEYMATGKAIVASDLPVLAEVLRSGENAVIVPGSDVEAWSEALLKLDADVQLRLRLGDAARRECAARYTWERRARNVLAGLELRVREFRAPVPVPAGGAGVQGGVP